MFKKMFWVLGFGGLFGGFLASWLAPKFIGWWFDPGVESIFNCKVPIQLAMQRLQMAQSLGALSGALITGLIFFIINNRRQPQV